MFVCLWVCLSFIRSAILIKKETNLEEIVGKLQFLRNGVFFLFKKMKMAFLKIVPLWWMMMRLISRVRRGNCLAKLMQCSLLAIVPIPPTCTYWFTCTCQAKDDLRCSVCTQKRLTVRASCQSCYGLYARSEEYKYIGRNSTWKQQELHVNSSRFSTYLN